MPRIMFVVLVSIVGLISSAHAALLKNNQPVQSYSINSISAQCIPLQGLKVGLTQESDARECAVIETGIIGKQDQLTLYYALYCLTPSNPARTDTCAQRRENNPEFYDADALVIFAQEGQQLTLKPLFEYVDTEIGIYTYGRPTWLNRTGKPILYVPIRVSGTGAGNASEYYLLKGKEWVLLDTHTWVKELNAKLPAGTYIWKGIWPNLQDRYATVGLYKKGDANCCPTGGAAVVQLELDDTRITIKSIDYHTSIDEVKGSYIETEPLFNRPKHVTEVPATPAQPPVVYPSLTYPFTMSSWLGNGFGVVAELNGTLQVEGDKARVNANTLRLRQFVKCDPKCVTIKSVAMDIYGETTRQRMHSLATSQPMAVNKTFERQNGILDLGKVQFEITLPDKLDINKLWLGLTIENADGGSYHTHTTRNLFARAMHANGKGDDACNTVTGIEPAIKTHCNMVLEQELNKWYLPLMVWWKNHFSDWQPITTAIHENNLEALKLLVTHDLSVDEQGVNGESPLMIASANGNTELARQLLSLGAKANYINTKDGPQKGRGPLISAIYSGNGEMVEMLLVAGAALGQADSHGWLPIHYAAYNTSIDGLRTLINYHADLNPSTTSGRGETPLMLAAQYGKLESIKLLLSAGANPVLQDRHGKNALDYAVFFNQKEAQTLLQANTIKF